MRLTRYLVTDVSSIAYLDLHPRSWPFHRSHSHPQRVNSNLVTEVFSERKTLLYAPQPHPCHFASGRVVSAPELRLSANIFRCPSVYVVDGVSSDNTIR